MEHMFIVSTPTIEKLPLSKMHLVLPHLYKNERYISAYKKLSEQGDFLMQDNSIFELKHVTGEDLVESAELIGAKEIVVPEVLRDSLASLQELERFFVGNLERDLSGFQFAAVVQGQSYEEVRHHYKQLCKYGGTIKTICIPFNLEFDAWDNRNNSRLGEELRQLGWNRFSIIWRLAQEGLWEMKRDRHHLLGLFNPGELAAYQQILGLEFAGTIRSNDSSSCFWHSLYGVMFDERSGLLYRKIETPVDFEMEYDHPRQFKTFEVNKSIIDFFRRGNGAEYICDTYSSLLGKTLSKAKGTAL